MRVLAALTLALVASAPAYADLAPDPTDPTTPDGAVAWIAVIAAAAALAVIWWRRRR
jgi:hypothetical protein